MREIVKVYPEAENNEASGYTLTISRTRIVSVPWRNASSVSSTETWMRAALTPLVQERVEPSRTDVLDRDPDDDARTAQ
ncbi:hypothetical protein MAHJHV54_47700 [Mycobacterium avium subsp. hominissuis]